MDPKGVRSKNRAISFKTSASQAYGHGHAYDNLSEDERQARCLFDILQNGNQEIGEADIMRVLQALGREGDVHEVLTIVDEIDQNGDRQIDYDEFLESMKRTDVDQKEIDDLKKAFRYFSSSENLINKDTLSQLIKEHAPDLDGSMALELFDFDLNNNCNYERAIDSLLAARKPKPQGRRSTAKKF